MWRIFVEYVHHFLIFVWLRVYNDSKVDGKIETRAMSQVTKLSDTVYLQILVWLRSNKKKLTLLMKEKIIDYYETFMNLFYVYDEVDKIVRTENEREKLQSLFVELMLVRADAFKYIVMLWNLMNTYRDKDISMEINLTLVSFMLNPESVAYFKSQITDHKKPEISWPILYQFPKDFWNCLDKEDLRDIGDDLSQLARVGVEYWQNR
jgi:hypothetical protein